MRTTRWAASFALAGMLALGLTACAGPDHPDVVVIEITGTGFEPAAITIAPGDEVRFVNRTPGRASVASTPDGPRGLTGPPAGGEPFTSGPLGEGETFATRLQEPGTYVYWADDHAQSDWVGSIEVEEPS